MAGKLYRDFVWKQRANSGKSTPSLLLCPAEPSCLVKNAYRHSQENQQGLTRQGQQKEKSAFLLPFAANKVMP